VTDPGMAELPVFQTVLDTLKNAGVAFEVFAQISPDPKDVDAHAGADAFKSNGCDSVIGVGGGSALDGAKAVALMATHDGHIVEYDDSKGGYEKINDTLPPIVAIPTTTGTGSEVGRSTVVLDTERNVKVVVFSPYLMPFVAILDPELHVGMPAWLTAATGMDALTHNVEALLSKGFHPMADSIALGGIRLIHQSLRTAVQDGSNLEARGHMALAAAMGATAFQKGLGVIHSLAHPCSTIAKVHHGLANGVLIETGLRFNRDVSEAALARIGRALQLSGNSDAEYADATIDWVANLRDDVGIAGRLSSVGVKEGMLPAMEVQALADQCHQSNPKPVTAQDIHSLYAQAY